MSEQARNKAGLHKEISSIFKGVPIPQNNGGQESSGTPALERTDYSEPQPPATEPQKPEAPKPHQFTQSLPKAVPAQQPKADIDDVENKISGSKEVPIWQTDDAKQPCETPVPERTGYTEPKPQKPEATPKPYQVTQSLSKSISAQQPKADIDDIEKNISQKSTTVIISSQTFLERIKNKLFTPKPGVSNTKQKTMAAMMPVLFIILLVFVFKGGVFGTKVRKTEASTEDNMSNVVTAGSNIKIDWKIPAPYPTTLRDPIRLGLVENAQTETETETETETRTLVTLIIKGILYTEDKASAVIGNQIVHEGEQVRGVTVVKISKDSVEFEMNGKRWTQKVQ